MITMAKGAALGAQGPQPMADILTYSKLTLTRLSRYAMQLPNLTRALLHDMAGLIPPPVSPCVVYGGPASARLNAAKLY